MQRHLICDALLLRHTVVREHDRFQRTKTLDVASYRRQHIHTTGESYRACSLDIGLLRRLWVDVEMRVDCHCRLLQVCNGSMAHVCHQNSVCRNAMLLGSTCTRVRKRHMRSARTKVCVTGTEENACTLMNCEEVITSLSAGVQVLLQQMTQTSTSTDLLDSILCCLICSLQQDQASSQVCKLMPWTAKALIAGMCFSTKVCCRQSKLSSGQTRARCLLRKL